MFVFSGSGLVLGNDASNYIIVLLLGKNTYSLNQRTQNFYICKLFDVTEEIFEILLKFIILLSV